MECKIWESVGTELVALHAKFSTPEQRNLVENLSNTMTNARLALQESNGVLDLSKYNQAKEALSAELVRFAMNEEAYSRSLGIKLSKYWGVQPNVYANAFEQFTSLSDIDKSVLESLWYDDDILATIKKSIIQKTIEEYDKSKFVNATIAKVADKTFFEKVKSFLKNIPSLFTEIGKQAEKNIQELVDSNAYDNVDLARRAYIRKTFKNDISDENLYELIAGADVDSDTIEAIMTYKYMNGGYVDFEVAKKLVDNKKLRNLIVGNDFWNNLKNIDEWGLEDFIKNYYSEPELQSQLLELIRAKPRWGDLNDAYVELQKLEESRDKRVAKGINAKIFDQVFPEYDSLRSSSDYIEIRDRVLDGLYEEWISNAALQKKIQNISSEVQVDLFNLKKNNTENLEKILVNKITKKGSDIWENFHYIKIKQANAQNNLTELAYQSTDYPLSSSVQNIRKDVHNFNSVAEAELWIQKNPWVSVVVNQHNVPENEIWANVITPKKGYRFEIDSKWGLHLQANGIGQLNKLFREVADMAIPYDQISDELYDMVRGLRNAQNNATLESKEFIYRNAEQKTVDDYLNTDYAVKDQDAFMQQYKQSLESMINRLYKSNVVIEGTEDLNFLKYFVFDNDYGALDAWMKKKGVASNPLIYTRGEQIERMYMQANLTRNRNNAVLFDYIIDNQEKLLRANSSEAMNELLSLEPKVKQVLDDNKIKNHTNFVNNMLSVLGDVQREGTFPIRKKVTKWVKKGARVWTGNNYIVAQLMKQEVPISAVQDLFVEIPNVINAARKTVDDLFDKYIQEAKELLSREASSQELSDLYYDRTNEIKAIQNYYFDLFGSPNNVYNEFRPVRIITPDDLKGYESAIASSETYADSYRSLNNEFWNKLESYVKDKNEITELDSLLKYGRANVEKDWRIVKISIDDVLSKTIADSQLDVARRLEEIGIEGLSLQEKRKALGFFRAEEVVRLYDWVKESGLKAVFGDVYNDLRPVKHVWDNWIYYIPKQVYDKISKAPDDQLENAHRYYRSIIYGDKVKFPPQDREILEDLFSPLNNILLKNIPNTTFNYKDIILGAHWTDKYIDTLLWNVKSDMDSVKKLADSLKNTVWEELDPRIAYWNTTLWEIMSRTSDKFNVDYDLAPPRKDIITEQVNPQKVILAKKETEDFIKTIDNC